MTNSKNASASRLAAHAEKVAQILVNTPSFNLIQECLQEALDEAGTTATPSCKHIYGRPRTGRSFALTDFESRFPPRREPCGLKKEVIYVLTPPGGTLKSLMSELLRNLGDPGYSSGTAESMRSRVNKQLSAVECRLIILDEFQHLVDKGQQSRLQSTIDWLKALVESKKISLVAVGLPGSISIIARDSQLRDRFDASISIDPYSWFDTSSRQNFRGLLQAIQKKLEPFETVDLASREIAHRLLLASSGRIGLLARIFDRAVKTAARQGRLQIRLEDLDAAYRIAVWSAPYCKVPGGPFFAELNDANIQALWQELSGLADKIPLEIAEMQSNFGTLHSEPAQKRVTKKQHNRAIKATLG